MSFQPAQNGVNPVLLGVTTTTGFTTTEGGVNTLFSKKIEGVRPRTKQITNTIISIIASAFIFISIVSIFDVLQNAINNYRASIALNDPRAGNSAQEILTTEIANEERLQSSLIFSVFAMVFSIIFVSILLLMVVD
jgi:hypothetical protein